VLHSGAVVPSSHLDDRIRDLCSRILDAPDCEFPHLLKDLQDALAEKTRDLRAMAASKLLCEEKPHSGGR